MHAAAATLVRAGRSQLGASIAQTFGTRVISIAIGVATTVAIARALGPGGRGLYAVAAAVAAIGVQLGNLGLQTSNTYFSSRDPRSVGTLAGNTVLTVAAAAIVALGLWALFAAAPSLSPIHGALLPLALAGIPIGLAYLLLQNLLLGVQRVRAYNVAELLTRASLLAVVVAIALAGGVRAAIVVAASLATQAFGSLWCWHALQARREGLAVSRAQLIASVRYGVRPYLAAFFAFVLLRGDLLMVKYMRGSTQAGYYSVAVSMADLLYVFPSVVAAVFFPYLVRQNNLRQQWRATVMVTAAVAGVLGAAALVSVWLAHPAVLLLFGRSFSPAVPAFTVLAAAIVFYGANNILSVAAAAAGYPWLAALIWIPGAAANLGLNALLIPRHGIVGSAFASLLCYAGVFLVQYLWLARYVRHAGQA